MNVGVCWIELRLPENESLKGKRQVVKSLIGRLQNRYNISVAEVDDNGLWQIAVLGVACVSNRRRQADETLSAVLRFIVQNYPNLEIVKSERETFSDF